MCFKAREVYLIYPEYHLCSRLSYSVWPGELFTLNKDLKWRQICCLPGVDSSCGASSSVLMLPFSVLGLYFFIFGPLLIKKKKSLFICPSFHRSFHPYLMTNASFSFPVPTRRKSWWMFLFSDHSFLATSGSLKFGSVCAGQRRAAACLLRLPGRHCWKHYFQSIISLIICFDLSLGALHKQEQVSVWQKLVAKLKWK